MSRSFFLVLIALALVLVGCSGVSSDTATQQIVNEQQSKYAITQPIPVFDWSLDRDTMIQIYKAKNSPLSTYTVFFSAMGQPIFVCPSLGFPIPGGTSLTNPDALAYPSSGGSSVISQAEPNGLFPPAQSAGTYVRCVRSNGDVVPIYAEPDVMTFPFPVTIGADGRITEVTSGKSTATLTTKQ